MNRAVFQLAVTVLVVLVAPGGMAQTTPNMAALRGLAPVSTLRNSPAGLAALLANYNVTYGIHTGAAQQPTLLPFPQQQQQALKDAFITSGNATELADALGTRLGSVYQSLAHYDGPEAYTNVSPAVADLFAYSSATSGSDSNAAKYFFANGTMDGKTPASPEAQALIRSRYGVTDVFGKSYGHPAGSAGADRYGNSRPFQTEPGVASIAGPDYFGGASENAAYLRGPAQDLTDSPSFPSGHTTYGYMESVLLGILLPERYPEQVVRAAEYGNDRIILGAHYAMDVIGGRTLALYDLAQLLANNPDYVGQPVRRAKVIADYPASLAAARADLAAVLQSGCGTTIALCAATDSSRFADPAANGALYGATQTYNLPVVHAATANIVEDVATIAPEAGYLLTAAFPALSLAQADAILTATEGPGGGFLDDGSAFGLYSRINLYAAAMAAQAAIR